MNCSFCNWDRRADKAAILPTETVYKLIDEAKKAKVESINFSQFNEPTLIKDLNLSNMQKNLNFMLD